MRTYAQISLATPESVKTAARAVETEVSRSRADNVTTLTGKAWSTTGGSKYDLMVSSYSFDVVWCYCACPFFRYHCEYVLSHAGSSRITVAKDLPPKTTNPDEKPMVCKHVWAVLEILKDSLKQGGLVM